MLRAQHVPRDPRPRQAVRPGHRARRARARGPGGARLRLPRLERRRQDDDDAHRARRPARRRRRDHAGAARTTATLPRQTWGYLPEERGLYPKMTVLDQLVFFAGLQGVPARRRDARGPLVARALPRPRVRRPARRGALEGQPAEGPVPRRGHARPAGPAHGRAVHGPRPGEHRAAARGDPRAPRPRQDDRPLDPPDGDGRGDVRVGRDRRPRPDGRRRAAARRQALDRPADGPAVRPRRPPARVAGRRSRRAPPAAGHRARGDRDRARRRARGGPRRGARRRARGSPTSRSPTRRSSRCSSSTSATRPTSSRTREASAGTPAGGSRRSRAPGRRAASDGEAVA